MKRAVRRAWNITGVGLQVPGGLVVRLGEHEVVQDLRGPRVVPGVEGAPAFFPDRLRADQVDVQLAVGAGEPR